MINKQQDLWGNIVNRREEYFVFHDESLPNKRWLIIGLLFIPSRDVDTVRELLDRVRAQENYYGEIHFSKLPKSFGGKWGAKARVAKKWINIFPALAENNLAYFSVLAVDRHSPYYEHKRFSKDFHAYNRFTALALKAGISWHLCTNDKVINELNITFVSDAKYRLSRPDKGVIDNFETYIPYRAVKDAFLSKNSRYPKKITLKLQLKDSADEDLIQYCDILLGAFQAALVGRTSRPSKQELAHIIIKWYHDLSKKPWNQEFGLFRKFSMWRFPDEHGKPSNTIFFELDPLTKMPTLFNKI